MLSEKQKEALWTELENGTLSYRLIVLAVNLPLRRGQIVAITEDVIDFEHEHVFVIGSKDRPPRFVPLNATATKVLKAKMSAGLARTMRFTVGLLLILGVAFALTFLTGQQPFAKSYFEFGDAKDFEGTIHAHPIPFLLVEKEEKNGGLPTFERFALVAEFKVGADKLVKDFDGQRVKLKGTKIYRDDLRMIEFVSGSIERSSGEARENNEKEESLGTQTLKGEIVDSKCY